MNETAVTAHEHVESFWGPHRHGDIEHVHPPGSVLAAQVGVRIGLDGLENVTPLELMHVLGRIAEQYSAVEVARQATDNYREQFESEPPSAWLPLYAVGAASEYALRALEELVCLALEEMGVPAIGLRSVESSNLAAVGFRPTGSSGAEMVGQLAVEFRGEGAGRLYVYDNVPERLADGLVMAQSAGSYFHSMIRLGGFVFQNVL